MEYIPHEKYQNYLTSLAHAEKQFDDNWPSFKSPGDWEKSHDRITKMYDKCSQYWSQPPAKIPRFIRITKWPNQPAQYSYIYE